MAAKGKSLLKLLLTCLFVITFQIVLSAKGARKESSSTKIVVIDAGHGGKDPGTVVGKAKEKNVVLDIALKLGDLIKKNQKGVRVVFTRDGDYFVPLMDRAQIANKLNANLFISIHANYCASPEIYGTETYILGLHRTDDNLNVAKKENSVILLEEDYTKRYEGFNPKLSESYIMFELLQDSYLEQSRRFALILQSNFKELAQRHDREVRQAGFLVLRETSMPSVLIETGYLSNKKENSFLLTDAGRSEIAQSIYGSLANYLNIVDTKDNLTVVPEHEVKAENVQAQKNKLSRPVVQEKPAAAEAKDTATPKDAKPAYQEKSKETVVKAPANAVPETKATNRKTQVRDTTGNKSSPKEVVATPVSYAIQIGVFSKKIDPKSKVFKGIAPIKEMVIDGKFKYFCGESVDLMVVKSNYISIAAKIPDAFIVSIKGNAIRAIK